MRIYAQFLTNDLNGNIVELCGSDGVYILDGRNNLMRHKAITEIRMEKLSKVHSDLLGYRIVKSNKFVDTDKYKNEVIYEKIMLKERD